MTSCAVGHWAGGGLQTSCAPEGVVPRALERAGGPGRKPQKSTLLPPCLTPPDPPISHPTPPSPSLLSRSALSSLPSPVHLSESFVKAAKHHRRPPAATPAHPPCYSRLCRFSHRAKKYIPRSFRGLSSYAGHDASRLRE